MLHRWTHALGFALALTGCIEDVEPGEDQPDPTLDMQAADATVDMGDDRPEAGPRDGGPRPDMPMGRSACDALVDLNAVAEPSGELQVYRTSMPEQPGTQAGSCGGRGNEEALAFTAPRPGQWFFSTTGPGTTFDTVLYVRAGCAEAASELACNDDVPGSDFRSALAVDLEAGQTVFVIIDSYALASGGGTRDIELTFGLAAVVGVDEDCDDIGRSCADGTLCAPSADGQRTCQEVRERAIGEPCDQRGQLGPCVAGAVCYGFGEDAVCEEVRERQVDEACDPQGDLGPCVEGSVCTGGRDGSTCEEVRVREEGEPCDPRGGTGPCAEGLVCRQLGQNFDDTFCVEVEILPEGSICAVDGSAGRCEDGTLCQAEDGQAPMCVAAVSACPAEWPVVDLNDRPQGEGRWQTDGSTSVAGTTVMTPVCGNMARVRTANVFAFEPQVDGLHTFTADAIGGDRDFDTLLEIRRLCGFAAAESVLACDDDGGDGFNSRAAVPLTAGELVYVLVTGAGQDLGDYTLSVTAP